MLHSHNVIHTKHTKLNIYIIRGATWYLTKNLVIFSFFGSAHTTGSFQEPLVCVSLLSDILQNIARLKWVLPVFRCWKLHSNWLI